MNENLEIKNKYLPIGTVVLLKDGTKKIMITGFYTKEVGESKIYDYSGCLYPEGFISSKEFYLFNHEQIKKIYHYGFINEEETIFKRNLLKSIEE